MSSRQCMAWHGMAFGSTSPRVKNRGHRIPFVSMKHTNAFKDRRCPFRQYLISKSPAVAHQYMNGICWELHGLASQEPRYHVCENSSVYVKYNCFDTFATGGSCQAAKIWWMYIVDLHVGGIQRCRILLRQVTRCCCRNWSQEHFLT